MTTCLFDLKIVDLSWRECLERGLKEIDNRYLTHLSTCPHWLPGKDKVFNALSLPLEKVNYVLFGESPYPRAQSANGYAFWDAAVYELWSPQGLSKRVNRATSLRNIIKMLLVAQGLLYPTDTSQSAIAALDKTSLIKTNDELFCHLLESGFLLLNATPVLADSPRKDAKAWRPFMRELLNCLIEKRPQVKFILLGNIANQINELLEHTPVQRIYAEHPYNHSFITNPNVINFFKEFNLLIKKYTNNS